MHDPRGGAVRRAGRPRRLGEEPPAAGGDWLCSRAERPGKGRRQETRAGRAAARRRRSRWWQRRKRPTAPVGDSGRESRMRVRVGLTLLLCALLLGTASAASGQYPPPRTGGREPPPPGLHPRAGPWGLRLGLHSSGHTSHQPVTRCHSLGFGWPELERVIRGLERGGEEGAVTLPTPLLTSTLQDSFSRVRN